MTKSSYYRQLTPVGTKFTRGTTPAKIANKAVNHGVDIVDVIKAQPFDNVPTKGFKVVVENGKPLVLDPRGFKIANAKYFINHLAYISVWTALDSEEEFVWLYDGGKPILASTVSQLYKQQLADRVQIEEAAAAKKAAKK